MNNNDEKEMDYNEKVDMDGGLNEKKEKHIETRFIILIVAVASLIVAALAAGILNMERPKTYGIEGLSITLTNKFDIEDETHTDYYVFLGGEFCSCELFITDPQDAATMDGAKDFYSDHFKLRDVKSYNTEGLSYFTCKEDADDCVYSSAVFLFENKNLVYVVWFTTLEEGFEDNLPQLREWAKTVVLE